MHKPYQIEAEKILLVPDLHQDIEFFYKIIEQEKGNYDHIVFLGDEFDSHKSRKEISGVKDVARFIIDVQNGKFGPATQLFANHTIQYAECWKVNQKYRNKRREVGTKCGGFTKNKALKINKILSWDNWMNFKPFCYFGNYLIVHGGLHPNFWNFYKSLEENLDLLYSDCKSALENICESQTHWSFNVSEVRGGKAKYSGIYWQDFDEEGGHDIEGFPKMITGHTFGEVSRVNKGNYCLDSGQNTYGLLTKDRKLTIKDRNGNIIQPEEVYFKSAIW